MNRRPPHSGHPALAGLLLERGADANAIGAGYNALHAAVLRGDLDTVIALLEHASRRAPAARRVAETRRARTPAAGRDEAS